MKRILDNEKTWKRVTAAKAKRQNGEETEGSYEVDVKVGTY